MDINEINKNQMISKVSFFVGGGGGGIQHNCSYGDVPLMWATYSAILVYCGSQICHKFIFWGPNFGTLVQRWIFANRVLTLLENLHWHTLCYSRVNYPPPPLSISFYTIYLNSQYHVSRTQKRVHMFINSQTIFF